MIYTTQLFIFHKNIFISYIKTICPVYVIIYILLYVFNSMNKNPPKLHKESHNLDSINLIIHTYNLSRPIDRLGVVHMTACN